jgi:glutathione S-transferase
MAAFPLTTLAIVLALFVYFGLAFQVGKARSAFNVPAPASAGHPEFDKRMRVQMNTLEQLALFLPAIFLGAPVLGDLWAALIGLVWSAGRIIYARSYYRDPATRSTGFMLTILPSAILLIAAIVGAVRTLL